MQWFALVCQYSPSPFLFFYFTWFTLNHFTLNILLHWHFCSCCCIGWTLGNCAWQSSLWQYYRASAWLQSSSIFVSLLLFHILFHIKILNPLLTSPYLSHIKIDSGTQLYFLFLIMLIMLIIQPSSLKICVGNSSIKMKIVSLSSSFHL